MKQSVIAAILTTSMCFSSVNAEPYCEDLLQTDTLPKKYQKKGPFYSDDDQGWIVANDQLITDFDFSDNAKFLMAKIADEFKVRGIKLVLAVAPPRPLFLSEPIVGYDRDKAAESFKSYLESISSTGVFAPNLYPDMQSALGEDAYFQRDTHWTPMGAAYSALNLAHQLGEINDVEESFSDLAFVDSYSEKGSLTSVVGKICNVELPPEEVMATSFSRHGGASDLLSDTVDEKQKVALAGTSFSNRYNRDVYRFSDALSFALDANIVNYSISGGGIISALETLILSDTFQAGIYKTVIWEVPYTQSLSDTNSLRQILGALQIIESQKTQEVYQGSVGKSWETISLSLNHVEATILSINTDSEELKQIDIELFDQNNEKTRMKLRKSNRVPIKMQSDLWSASLEGFALSDFKKLKIRLKGAKSSQKLSINLIN